MIGTVSGLVSVIMLVRDRAWYTRKALESLAACEADLEFVIVDNGSGPATGNVIEEFHRQCRHPVEVLRFTDDAGGSGRRNAGAAAARGEYLFFVDNDVVADDPGAVAALAAELSLDPRLAAVSPLLLYPGASVLVQCAGGGSTLDGRIGLVGRGQQLTAQHRACREQTWAPTAALLVRKDSFARAGGFDVAFDPVPLCEDVDLCCRLRAAGDRIRYLGAASMRHYEGMTFDHVGHDKLPIWKGHVRVLRGRWAEIFARGPAHDAEALKWRTVVKDYSDPELPRVRLLAPGETAPGDSTFFASSSLLHGPPPVPEVRVAIAGCGQAAVRGALPAFARPQRHAGAPPAAPFLDFGPVRASRVTGVADPDLMNLVATARWYDVPHTLRDAEALVETVPMEGLIVCTPPAWHAKLTQEAVRRGLPVLVEKPAALTQADTDAMVSAAEATGTYVAVNLPWAHHPGLNILAELVRSGIAGVPRSFAVVFEHSGPQAWAPRASWYWRSGGGVITDLGLHTLDALGRALAVQPCGAAAVKTTTDAGVPVRACAEVTAGTCTGTVEVGWDAPAPRFTVRVKGDEAALDVALLPYRSPGLAVKVRDAGGATLTEVPVGASSGGPGAYAEFAASLRGGPLPRTCLDKVGGSLRTMICWAEAASAVPAQR